MERLRLESTCDLRAHAGAAGPGKPPVSQGQTYWPLRARVLLLLSSRSAEMSAVFTCVKGSYTEGSCLKTRMWCFYSKNNVGLQGLRK